MKNVSVGQLFKSCELRVLSFELGIHVGRIILPTWGFQNVLMIMSAFFRIGASGSKLVAQSSQLSE
jgi:hypothetical protein